MNKFILIVQGYLLYPENYTREQLERNYRDAAIARTVAYAYAAAVVAASAATYASAAAAAEYWVNKYFKHTGENRQDYIDAINEELNNE